MTSTRWFDRRKWGWGLIVVGGLALVLQVPAYGQAREDRPGGPGPRPQCPLPGGPGPHGPHAEAPPAPPGPGAFGLISPQQTEQLMQFLEEHFPRRHGMLRRLRERDPEAFQRRIAEMAPRVLELLLRMKENPELGELLLEQQRLEEELRAQMKDYRDSDEENEARRDESKARIEEMVSRLVEIRLQRREHEIAALERRLEKQRRRLEQDRENRDELVAEELEDLLKRRFGSDRWPAQRRQRRNR